MQKKNFISSFGIILVVAGLTVLFTLFVFLLLSQTNMIEFTGGGWIVNVFFTIMEYLGYSVLFFIPVFTGYCFYFLLLRKSLKDHEAGADETENIRFYNGGMEICTTLFFAIGVLFTAWGMQNALVSALGNVSEVEAGQIGAWGILKRLVDNGILIALWTTIIGGGGGYLMRLFKHTFLGRALNRFSINGQEVEKQLVLNALKSINIHVERIEQRVNSLS